MPAPHNLVFYSRMPFLSPNQQRQSTEGTMNIIYNNDFWISQGKMVTLTGEVDKYVFAKLS